MVSAPLSAARAGDEPFYYKMPRQSITWLWHRINDERLARSRTSMARLAEKTRLRSGPSVSEAALTIWSLTGPELYTLRVATAGGSPDDYERWLAGLLIAVLLHPNPSGTDVGSSESRGPRQVPPTSAT